MYCNGCSYTYGIGTAEFENVEQCLGYSWPNQLAELLDKDHINQAEPGSSNARIFRDSAIYLYNNPDTELAIIMWSDAPRIEIFRPQEAEFRYQAMSQITPQGVGGTKSYFHREALESYYAFLHSNQKAVVETLGYMISLQSIADSLSIPLIQQHYKANITNYLWDIFRDINDKRESSQLGPNEAAFECKLLDMISILRRFPHVHGLNWQDDNQEQTNTSMRSTCTHRGHCKDSKISLGHPDRDAHVMYAEYLAAYIKEHDVLS
jgi:hypothetical protein